MECKGKSTVLQVCLKQIYRYSQSCDLYKIDSIYMAETSDICDNLGSPPP